MLGRYGLQFTVVSKLALLYLGDLQPAAALGDAPLDDVALAISEQGCADGGQHRDPIPNYVGVTRKDERVALNLLAIQIAEPDRGIHRDHVVGKVGRVLYDQALIGEGSKILDPVAFARRVNELIVSALGS